MEGDQAELKAVMERETKTADVDTTHNCESLDLSVILFIPVYGLSTDKKSSKTKKLKYAST